MVPSGQMRPLRLTVGKRDGRPSLPLPISALYRSASVKFAGCDGAHDEDIFWNIIIFFYKKPNGSKKGSSNPLADGQQEGKDRSVGYHNRHSELIGIPDLGLFFCEIIFTDKPSTTGFLYLLVWWNGGVGKNENEETKEQTKRKKRSSKRISRRELE